MYLTFLHGCSSISLWLWEKRLTYTYPNLLFHWSYNLHYLLFSGIGALLCHHPYCFPSQSQTLFGTGAGRPPITAVARWKYLRLCWRGGWGGGVDVVVLSTFRNTHIVHIVRDYVFSFIRIYLFIFLTFWIFILLLVARYCVTLFSDTEMIYQKIDNAVTKVMPLSARRWWWQKQQRFKAKKVFLTVKFSYKAAF